MSKRDVNTTNLLSLNMQRTDRIVQNTLRKCGKYLEDREVIEAQDFWV